MRRRLALLIALAALPLIARAQAPVGPGIAASQHAKGDQQRHYFFTEAAAEMPYRLYVPQRYDPAKPTPLVVALHGYGGDQDYFFTALE
jgi:predicted peptidase